MIILLLIITIIIFLIIINFMSIFDELYSTDDCHCLDENGPVCGPCLRYLYAYGMTFLLASGIGLYLMAILNYWTIEQN